MDDLVRLSVVQWVILSMYYFALSACVGVQRTVLFAERDEGWRMNMGLFDCGEHTVSWYASGRLRISNLASPLPRTFADPNDPQ